MSNLSNTMVSGRRVSLPVDPAFVVYSHFEHVYGRAASQDTRGVSISQLKLLDILIGRLSQIRDDAAFQSLAAPGEEVNSAYVDALIETYRNEIQQTLAASAAMPYLPSPNAQSGAVFSMVA